MGITQEHLTFINPYIRDRLRFGQTEMCEFGNQHIKDGGGTGKQYFTKMGFNHVSIDINEKDDALPLDLCQPINLGPFDIVTNFGTVEHVGDQYMVFYNMHNLCKPDGLLMHCLPIKEYNGTHGKYTYQENFLENLVVLADYCILRYWKTTDSKRSKVLCVLQKRKLEFVSREAFEWLPFTSNG